MAGPAQPHPLGSGIFLQGFSRGSCLYSLLFPSRPFGASKRDIGTFQATWSRGLRDEWEFFSKMGYMQVQDIFGATGRKGWGDLECHGQQYASILKVSRLFILKVSTSCTKAYNAMIVESK